MPTVLRSRGSQSGNVMLEFALSAAFLVPLFLGMVGFGLMLNRGIQTEQVCRDAGHMFLDSVDLSTASNQRIVGRLAFGMGMTDSGGAIDSSGKGVVILTQLLHTSANYCLSTDSNYDRIVITKRIVIGNATLRASSYGTPTAAIIQSDGTIAATGPTGFCNDSSVLYNSGSAAALLNLTQNQLTYASEAYFITPELAGFLVNMSGTSGVSASYAFNFF